MPTSVRLIMFVARVALSLSLAVPVVSCASGPPQSRLAAGVPTVGGNPDLVGNGGPQDDLARQIYHTGHDVTEILGGD